MPIKWQLECEIDRAAGECPHRGSRNIPEAGHMAPPSSQPQSRSTTRRGTVLGQFSATVEYLSSLPRCLGRQSAHTTPRRYSVSPPKGML